MIPPRPDVPPPPAPVPSVIGVAVDRALNRAEQARERFDRELEGLIEDLREAQGAIRGDEGDDAARGDDERGG